jgi:hypothetical protein
MPSRMTRSRMVENTMRAGDPIQIIVEAIPRTPEKQSGKLPVEKSLRQNSNTRPFLAWSIPARNNSRNEQIPIIARM